MQKKNKIKKSNERNAKTREKENIEVSENTLVTIAIDSQYTAKFP